MNRLGKFVGTALIGIPMLGTTLSFADTTAASGVSTTAAVTQANKFDAQYQKNQQTESTLQQQAQQVSSPNASAYASMVNTLQAQISSLYASEQTLAQAQTTWSTLWQGGSQPGMMKKEIVLEAKLKQMNGEAAHLKGKSHQDRAAMVRVHSEIDAIVRALNHLRVLTRVALGAQYRAGASSYVHHLDALRQTILGLQWDEILVTKRWIASKNQTVTGSVYGSSSTTTTTTVTAGTP